MKTKLVLKVACLVALGVSLFFVRSTVVSRMKVARASQVEHEETKVHTSVSVPDAAAERLRTGNKSVARTSFHLETVAVNGDSIRIAAKGHVWDIRPGIEYVWGVTILGGKDYTEILHQKIYDHQAFFMPESKETPLDFEEKLDLQLQPGKYLAKLSLFHLDKNAGVTIADLADTSKQDGFGLSGSELFVVNH